MRRGRTDDDAGDIGGARCARCGEWREFGKRLDGGVRHASDESADEHGERVRRVQG